MKRKPLDSQAAIASAIDYLLREFRALPKPTGSGGTIINQGVTFTGPIEAGFYVASAGASTELRAVADYTCDGVEDESELQAAINALPTQGGYVVLDSGDYNFTKGISSTVPVWLRGVGIDKTVLIIDEAVWADDSDFIDFSAATDCKVSDFEINSTGTGSFADTFDVISLGAGGVVEDVKISDQLMFRNSGPFQWGVRLVGTGDSSYISRLSGLPDVLMAGGSISVSEVGVLEIADTCICIGNTTLGFTVTGTPNSASDSKGVMVGNSHTGTVTFDGACGTHLGNCYIDGNAQTNAIILQNGSDRNTLQGFTIGGTCTNGVNISSADCNDTVIGVIVVRGATNNIVDSGTDTVFIDVSQTVFTHGPVIAVTTGLYEITFIEDVEIIEVEARVAVAPTGTTVIVDVQKDGTSNNLYTTQANRPTIALAAKTSTTVPDVTAVAAGSYLTVDVDQKDSNDVAVNLSVTVRYRRA